MLLKDLSFYGVFFKGAFPPRKFDEIEIKLENASVFLNTTWGRVFLLSFFISSLLFTQSCLTCWQDSWRTRYFRECQSWCFTYSLIVDFWLLQSDCDTKNKHFLLICEGEKNQWLFFFFLFPFCLLKRDILGFCLVPSVVYLFLQPTFFFEGQEFWCQCYDNYASNPQSTSKEKGNVSSIFYYFFFYCMKFAGIVSLVFWSPVWSRHTGFPFCSVGYVSLLFLLRKIETVLIYCSKCCGVIYDKEHTTQCSGWVLIS